MRKRQYSSKLVILPRGDWFYPKASKNPGWILPLCDSFEPLIGATSCGWIFWCTSWNDSVVR